MTGALWGTGAAPPDGAAGAVAVLEQAASSMALDNAANPHTLVLAFMLGAPQLFFVKGMIGVC
jgi:hypothetical protein